MRQPTPSKNETFENILLLWWVSIFVALVIYSCIKNRKENAEKKATSALDNLRTAIKSEKEFKQQIRHKKFRVRVHAAEKKDEDEAEAHFSICTAKPEKNVSDIITTKSAKRRDSKETTDVALTLFSTIASLPTEIRFSDEFIYPSPPNAQNQVCPLPGQEKSKPVARVQINDHSMLVYNTHFGVLTTNDFPDETQVAIHKHCIENGNVVFARESGFFKTHPVGTGGDVRTYAKQKIKNNDGLTLHLFDTVEQHAHGRK